MSILRMRFDLQNDHAPHLLCIGAHSDDIEIGCGGTILRLLTEYQDLSVTWIVLSATGVRAGEASDSAQRFLEPAREKTIILKEYQDGFFPYRGGEIKSYFEELKLQVSPDVIFTHYGGDLHQDHRLVHELTWNTFRDNLILEYEIPKFDGDFASPNFFIPLTGELVEKKVEIILDSFVSQREKRWFTADTFLSVMRLRGIESNSASGYSEAFFARKIVS